MLKVNSQKDWFERAKKVLPGASFGNFEPSVFIKEGKGSRIWDEDDNEYVDYLIGSGPMLLGHGNEEVLEAVYDQLTRGMTFFTNNSVGVQLAEEISEAVKCAEHVRYVSSGGEADMYAIRLARAFTGKNKIIKFEGGYHGMCAEAQMSLAPTHFSNFPQPVPDSAGIPNSVQSEVLIAPFNDIHFVQSLIKEYSNEIACIIVEPLQRIIPPKRDFLKLLRDECNRAGILLIFDEIVTGFRFSYGGAQEYYDVYPDICTLGKIIGGGFPLAAIAGRKDIMCHFDKEKVGQEGFLMQLGTLSGNPVAAVAGLKTMEIMKRDKYNNKMRETGQVLMDMFSKKLNGKGVPHKVVGDQTLFDVLFTESEVNNYRDVVKCDLDLYNRFNKKLRANGLFKPPGKIYVSGVIDDDDLLLTEKAIDASIREIFS